MMKKGFCFLLGLLLLAGCARKPEPEAPNAMRPSVMHEGVLYSTTGKQLPAEVDESAIVGYVTSTVPLSQLPTENGQSNCGNLGAPYAVTSDGFLVLVDHEWTLFEPAQ